MMISRSKTVLATLVICAVAPVWGATAGEANVVAAEMHQSNDGTYRFDVTVQHDDTGWDHYANAFQILDADGNVLGTRVLAHPHVHEQPFTRSISGVAIPDDVTEIVIRAVDSVHGTGGGQKLTLQLP